MRRAYELQSQAFVFTLVHWLVLEWTCIYAKETIQYGHIMQSEAMFPTFWDLRGGEVFSLEQIFLLT